MALVHRRMAFDVEKVRIMADKLNRFFLAPLESFPIEVLAVSTGQSVKSFRIEKLDDDYFQTVKQVEQMVEEEENRRRHPETSTDARKDRRKDSQLQRKESFLEGLSQSTIDFKLESKMRRLLSKYRERKNQETIRQQEWEEHKASKPDPNVNDPADDLAIREAASSIGDYNLKSDPEYEPTEERVETATGKYHELLRVRREMFALRNEYNGKVFALREQKVALRQYVEKQKSKLREIHVEIPADRRRQLPREVVIDVGLEYAEDQYKFEEDRKKIDTAIQGPTRKQGIKGTPEYYDAILQEALGLDRPDEAKGSGTVQTNKHEQELRELRLVRKLFKQDKIIDKVARRIVEFDKELEKLSHERLVVETDAKLLENFQLTLYQELWILKDFSAIETDILSGVEQVTIERNGLLQAVQDARVAIERVEQEIELIQKEQRSNLQRFNSTCLDNEFAKVMKRIYKKKFKPCKINDNDSDSSSEYSSEDIDGLDAAANDGEVSKVFLDLNHCPAGCDPDTYNLAIQLRNEKLELQRRHYAEDRTLRELHKTLEHLKPQLADAEIRLGRKKHELLELRREKQRRLNDIDTLVIVKMDQMQYFRIETEFHDVEHSLLFNREALLKLYARVEQLAAETLETKRRHRVNVVHLARMKTDIKYMRQQLVALREQIGQTMVKKFGRVIDLDELEETILRQYTFEMRANLDDVKKNYDERTRELKKLYSKKREELKKVIQEGTEKLHVLTVLQEEYNNLEKALAHQKELQEKRAHPPPTYSDDLSKLREIAKIQKEQVNTLQREIRTLSMKCKPLSAESPDVEITIPPPVCGKPPPIPDESVYNAVMDSAPPSTRASTPDNFLYNEIASLIDDFLVEQLGSRVLQSDIKRVVNHLAHYLSNIIHNFAPEHASDLLPHIIENFKSFIPEELLITIPPQAIAELIESIFRTFKEGYDIDTKEILGEIVGNSLEMIFPASQNYSHNILVDIMKQVLATLHIADVNHPDTIGFIANGIRHKPGIDPDGVDVPMVSEELLLYAQENTVDDISLELIKGVLEGILQCVREPPEP
uniref:Uncharacterized protein n=1 Tax=Anopheles atroparvus TaxID=41427 RepID=A0AAG5DEX7_ANOAO